ncbi:MAG TPA: TolC family outer membrane protein [Steroidobacteraceae bacterium]|nr:TolC family outer membrane protein [Steroidobacteraceae bacterium]
MRRLIPFVLLACVAPSAGALDLIEAHRAAREHDADFAAQMSAAEAGREYAVQSRAALLPRVNVSGQAGRRNQEVKQSGDLSSLLTSNASGNVYGYSVSISQPLYRPDAMADRRSLAAQSEISTLSFRAAEQDLILRVAQTYFGVLLAQDSLVFAKAQRAAVAEQLAAAKERFDSGRARVTDVAEAQANFDALAAAEIAAESDLAVSRARFFALTGRDGEDPDPIAGGKTAAALDDLQAWLNRARAGSLEIRVRERESAIAESEIKRTSRAGRLSVDIVAKVDDSRQDGELSPLAYPDQSTTKSIGLQFSMPVFAGGALESRHRQAVAQRNQAQQQLEATRREVEVDVRQAHTQVTSGALRVAALEQGLVSAQTSLEAGELGREVGNRTNLDVLNLQQQVYDVKRDLADARYGYLLTQLQLAALAGELTENDLNTLIRR